MSTFGDPNASATPPEGATAAALAADAASFTDADTADAAHELAFALIAQDAVVIGKLMAEIPPDRLREVVAAAELLVTDGDSELTAKADALLAEPDPPAKATKAVMDANGSSTSPDAAGTDALIDGAGSATITDGLAGQYPPAP